LPDWFKGLWQDGPPCSDRAQGPAPATLMAAEIYQINNQKRDDHSRKAESEDIADMIAGDASARSYRRNHRLPSSPLVGFLIFWRLGISTHERPLSFRQPCLVNQIAIVFLGCRLSAKIARNICVRTDIETVLLCKKRAAEFSFSLRSRSPEITQAPAHTRPGLYRDGLVVGLFVLLPGVVELPVPGIPPLAPVPLAVPPVPVPAPPAPPVWAHESETIPKVNAKPSANIAIFFTLFTPKKLHRLFNGPRKHKFPIQILSCAN
jgi:hypothetical protein